MKNKKILIWAAASIVIIAISAWLYFSHINKVERGEATPEPQAKLVNDVTGSPLTYKQAVIVFAKERLAFGENCEMTPNKFSAESGKTVMFDNRFRDARVIRLDGVSHNIPGYGFKLLQLKSTKLPHVVEVECNGKDAGEITLK